MYVLLIFVALLLLVIGLFLVIAQQSWSSKDHDQTYDLVIVGGGVSGFFCARRIKEFYPHYKILLLERGVTIGGRLQSIPYKNSDIAIEAGGMRTFPSEDDYTSALIKQLDLETIEVPYIAPENLVYLRGYQSRIQDLPKDAGKIYHLRPDERNKSVGDYIQDIQEDVGFSNLTSREQYFEDARINQTSYWKLLRDYLSNEAVNYYQDVFGYNFTVDDISAATGLYENSTIGGTFPQYFIKDGYRQVVTKMAENLDVEVRLQNELVKINKNGDYLDLVIQPIAPKDIQQPLTPDELKRGQPYQVTAKKVILAIPRNDLVPVYNWSTATLAKFNQVEDWEAVKIFVEFDDFWWYDLGLSHGRSVTDIPMRQVWYYLPDYPVLMIYADDINSHYWESMGPQFEAYPVWHPASEHPILVAEIKKQLVEMYRVPPERLSIRRILYQHWPYGVYFWKPGDIPTIRHDLMQPEDVPIYIAGDSFAYHQSWVDGALEFTDEMLQTKWGLPGFLESK